MEIIGDDKKLRALFSEAQRTDAAATPSFNSVWHRAQTRALKPRRAFFTHICHDLPHEATNAALPENVKLSYDGMKLEFEI